MCISCDLNNVWKLYFDDNFCLHRELFWRLVKAYLCLCFDKKYSLKILLLDSFAYGISARKIFSPWQRRLKRHKRKFFQDIIQTEIYVSEATVKFLAHLLIKFVRNGVHMFPAYITSLNLLNLKFCWNTLNWKWLLLPRKLLQKLVCLFILYLRDALAISKESYSWKCLY